MYLLELVSILGLILSLYILVKKSKKEKISCPIGGKCNLVLNSKYSTTFGFRNELIGVIYYFFIFFSTLINIKLVLVLAKFSAIVSVLFSIYLAYIQFFKIKQFCSYCYFSYVLNLLILVLIL